MEAKLEDQFVLFLDFLGFSEASKQIDDETRSRLLKVLALIAALRSDFKYEPNAEPGAFLLNPAISMFSDHVVASYPLSRISVGNDIARDFTILINIHQLVSKIAATALSIGFLVRGGVAIGPLYHSSGVAFGAGLVEAYNLESRVSIYPRIVLSSAAAKRLSLEAASKWVQKDVDGLHSINYYTEMLELAYSARTPDTPNITAWYQHIIANIADNIDKLGSSGKLNELAKWTWFAQNFSKALNGANQARLDELGVDPELLGQILPSQG